MFLKPIIDFLSMIMHNLLDDGLGFQPPTYPFENNSYSVQIKAPTSSGPFLSNSSWICGQKTLFLTFLKPIIDLLSIVMLNSLDDGLGFNHHHLSIGKWVKIQKSAQRMIFKFFALKLYISWEAETPEKPPVLLKQSLRLDKLAVYCCTIRKIGLFKKIIKKKLVRNQQNKKKVAFILAGPIR